MSCSAERHTDQRNIAQDGVLVSNSQGTAKWSNVTLIGSWCAWQEANVKWQAVIGRGLVALAIKMKCFSGEMCGYVRVGCGLGQAIST